MTEKIRLQVYLARAGVASRRAAEKLILAGRVSVNGKLERKLGTTVDPERDRVLVGDRALKEEKKVLFLFHKPRGVVTTLRDPHAPKSLEPYLSEIPERVYPVGRLDADVSGILLLTNDGEFTEQMLHPRFEVERVYVARVKGNVDESSIRLLSHGVTLEDGEIKSAIGKKLRRTEYLVRLLGPAREEESYIELRVHEGSKHFVKKLLSASGHPVLRLSRVAFGPFSLGDLAPGAIKPLRFPISRQEKKSRC